MLELSYSIHPPLILLQSFPAILYAQIFNQTPVITQEVANGGYENQY